MRHRPTFPIIIASDLRSREDIVRALDCAMGILNACSVAMRDLGFVTDLDYGPETDAGRLLNSFCDTMAVRDNLRGVTVEAPAEQVQA